MREDLSHTARWSDVVRRSCKFQDKGCIYYHPPVRRYVTASPDRADTVAQTSQSEDPQAPQPAYAVLFTSRVVHLTDALSTQASRFTDS